MAKSSEVERHPSRRDAATRRRGVSAGIALRLRVSPLRLCGSAALREVFRLAAVAVAVLAATSCGQRAQPPAPPAAPSDWLEFEGTWNAAGTRRTISLGDGRSSSVVELKGTMLLTGPGRPDVGFLSDTVALVDSSTGLVGRCVWTDENGDQVFSELTGQGAKTNNHLEGTIIGGTGRYAAANGTYGFSWQYVVEAEDGSIQGRAVELKGRVRLTPPASGGQQ
jgi:hypothetical protein